MKRVILSVLLICTLVPVLSAQEISVYESEHYRVNSRSGRELAIAMANRLESYLALYNELFRFDLESAPYKMRVQLFDDKGEFDSYLQRLIGETRDEFVYLHYSEPSRSELVGYVSGAESYDRSLSHQASVQFMRTFIPNVPLWLREGLAVHFEDINYDSLYGASLRTNLSWLDTLKDYVIYNPQNFPFSLEQILALDVDEAKANIEAFYPVAWGMVHFLINSDQKRYNRILWDGLRSMDRSNSYSENEAAFARNGLDWVDGEELLADFLSFLDSQKTYKELVELGINNYNDGQLDQAHDYFQEALLRQSEGYVPEYYLGLINYDRGNYTLAEFYYSSALNHGAASAITNYALGVNAFADNRLAEAETYLTRAADADSSRFGEKVDELLERINFERSSQG